MSDFSSAIVNLRHVWRTDKDDAEIRGKLLSAYTLRGHALYNSQLYQESMDAFRKARELDPDSLSLQMKCMDCLRELEEFDKCMSLIQQCLGKHPSNPHLLVLRARMNILFGKVTSLCVLLCLFPMHTYSIVMVMMWAYSFTHD